MMLGTFLHVASFIFISLSCWNEVTGLDHAVWVLQLSELRTKGHLYKILSLGYSVMATESELIQRQLRYYEG